MRGLLLAVTLTACTHEMEGRVERMTRSEVTMRTLDGDVVRMATPSLFPDTLVVGNTCRIAMRRWPRRKATSVVCKTF